MPGIGHIAAQQPGPAQVDLPSHVAETVVAFLNDSATVRFNGRSSVPAGRAVIGDVGVLGGPFRLAGAVEGDLVVANGDLVLEPGARIDGDVLVVGGSVDGELSAVAGELTVYEAPLRYSELDGRLRLPVSPTTAISEGGWGSARFTVRNGGSYNRVEGLPVVFGPMIETAGTSSLRLEALGLWRSEAGFTLDDDQLGYLLRARQRLGSGPAFTLGATLHSRVDPIDGIGLSGLESSLSTFLLHKDYRDHFEREGWSVSARLAAVRMPLAVRVEYRDERHRFSPVSSPWTLRRNDDPWRPQPVVGEGEIRSVSGEAVLDSRDDRADPSDGWFMRLRVSQGLGGELRRPELFDAAMESVAAAADVPSDFTSGLLDLRRYNRVTPDSDLALRFVYAGALKEEVLPPQFQHALGGEGSLPGYRLFSLDCGARNRTLRIEREAYDDDEDPTQIVFPEFGCDRAVLFQAHLRGRLPFGLDPGLGPGGDDDWEEESWAWYPPMDLTPGWAAFLDIGRGWSGTDGDGMDGTGTAADIGFGITFGDFGLYWAYPLNDGDRSVNFFVRLQRRF